jgi:hypothetical protein
MVKDLEDMAALYENDRFQVIVTGIDSEQCGRTEVYGVRNIQTRVIEHRTPLLSDAMAKADVENSILANELWKDKASAEIEM